MASTPRSGLSPSVADARARLGSSMRRMFHTLAGHHADETKVGVPIGVPLECRVRLAERDGRKLHMTGELTGGESDPTVFTRARATFIAIDASHFGAGSA